MGPCMLQVTVETRRVCTQPLPAPPAHLATRPARRHILAQTHRHTSPAPQLPPTPTLRSASRSRTAHTLPSTAPSPDSESPPQPTCLQSASSVSGCKWIPIELPQSGALSRENLAPIDGLRLLLPKLLKTILAGLAPACLQPVERVHIVIG